MGACPRPPQGKVANTATLKVPPASLDLVGVRTEEVAESGCERDSLGL